MERLDVIQALATQVLLHGKNRPKVGWTHEPEACFDLCSIVAGKSFWDILSWNACFKGRDITDVICYHGRGIAPNAEEKL